MLLGNAVSVDQVVVSHLPGLEQLLVTFPRTIASGFTGTPDERRRPGQPPVLQQGPALHRGLQARNQWRRADQLTDAPIFPAQCNSPAPYNMRGTKYAPAGRATPASAGRVYRATTTR